MKRDFNKWLETFRSSICDYKFYVDFEKVYGNVESIKVVMDILREEMKNDDPRIQRIIFE